MCKVIYLKLCDDLCSSGPPVWSETEAMVQDALQDQGQTVWDSRNLSSLQGVNNLSRVHAFKWGFLGKHVLDGACQRPDICRLALG